MVHLLIYVMFRGQAGTSELEDFSYNTTKSRRRTNSSTNAAGHNVYKTKFEAVDPEVIEFEEEVHGAAPVGEGEDGLEKMSTGSSADTMGSVNGEEGDVAAGAVAREEKK